MFVSSSAWLSAFSFYLSVNGTLLDKWVITARDAGMEVYYALCGDQKFYRSRMCSEPMNGGVPCKEKIERTLPKQHAFAPPYRCDGE